MHAPGFLTELVLLIAMAAAGVALFERLRLPAIAGFLVTGAVLGPGGFGLVSDQEAVRTLAEFGVVFLLFEIGLEIPLDRLRRRWRVAVAAGGLQVAVTLAGAALAAAALGLPGPTAVVVGALLAMSSTALVMRMLSERGEIDAPHGQLAVGILLFQDLCVVPFLLAVPLLATQGGLTPLPVLAAGGRAVLALALFFAVARFVLPRVLDHVARLRSRELFTLVAVLVVVGAAVAAERIGLTLAVGAFLAGLVASASPYGDQLFAETIPLRGVLLGIFFTAVGMLLDPGHALAHFQGVGLFVLAAVVGKGLIVFGVLALVLRQGVRLALLAGLTLAQTGEFSFVLAGAAAAVGLLDSGLHQTFIAGSVFSLLATPFLVRAGPALANRVAGLPLRGEAAEVVPGLSGHALVIGFGLAGRNLARVLRAIDVPYVVLEANATAVSEARAAGEPVVYGDATRAPLLQRLGAARARAVAVAITDPIATRQVVAVVRSLNPSAPIVARTRYVLEVDPLQQAGASAVVAEEVEAALDLVAKMLRAFDIPGGTADRFVSELRDEGYELLRAPAALALDPWLRELLEDVVTEWVEVADGFGPERRLDELRFRSRTGASVLAVERGGVTAPNPSADATLRPGDRALLFGAPAALARARALLAGEEAA